MALTEADIESFIEALHQDAALRERVRGAILSDDFLALPGLVRQLGERVDQITERFTVRMDQIDARLETVAANLEELTGVVRKHDGRLGNVEGTLYELNYKVMLPSRLGPRYRDVRPVALGDLDAVTAARDAGKIDDADWEDLFRVEVAAQAKRRSDGMETLVVMELSLTVDERDVTRVHQRASILRALDLEVDACVAGERILPAARRLADELNVIALVEKEAAAA